MGCGSERCGAGPVCKSSKCVAGRNLCGSNTCGVHVDMAVASSDSMRGAHLEHHETDGPSRVYNERAVRKSVPSRVRGLRTVCGVCGNCSQILAGHSRARPAQGITPMESLKLIAAPPSSTVVASATAMAVEMRARWCGRKTHEATRVTHRSTWSHGWSAPAREFFRASCTLAPHVAARCYCHVMFGHVCGIYLYQGTIVTKSHERGHTHSPVHSA